MTQQINQYIINSIARAYMKTADSAAKMVCAIADGDIVMGDSIETHIADLTWLCMRAQAIPSIHIVTVQTTNPPEEPAYLIPTILDHVQTPSSQRGDEYVSQMLELFSQLSIQVGRAMETPEMDQVA